VTETDPRSTSSALEEDLYAIPDVVVARVTGVGGDEPAEISLLVRPDADTERIDRVVREAVRARFGAMAASLRIQPLAVASALDHPRPAGSLATGPRPRLGTVTTVTEGDGLRAEVTLECGREVRGRASGRQGPSGWPVTIAEATLSALGQLSPPAGVAFVESVDVVESRGRQIVVVLLVVRGGRHDEQLFGAALLRSHDVANGVARAVLDATNRRLPFLAAD
jgi:hypothetical protein